MPSNQLPAALVERTGSPAHVDRLTALASKVGRSFKSDVANEAQVYEALGLTYIPPEMREDCGEIELAGAPGAFDDLVALPDIVGMVHCHTVYSDGKSTVLEMAREAEAMGMILDAIAASRAAIEVNGDPSRLDLPPEWIREARARGIPFTVSVDAHSTRGLHNLIYGVHTARRGGLRRAEVLNTLPVDEFIRRVRPAA